MLIESGKRGVFSGLDHVQAKQQSRSRSDGPRPKSENGIASAQLLPPRAPLHALQRKCSWKFEGRKDLVETRHPSSGKNEDSQAVERAWENQVLEEADARRWCRQAVWQLHG